MYEFDIAIHLGYIVLECFFLEAGEEVPAEVSTLESKVIRGDTNLGWEERI